MTKEPTRETCSYRTVVGAEILVTARCRSGPAQFMSRLIVGLATTLLVSAGLGCVALGPVAGIAHAGDFHWCPGDPPPQGANGHGGPRLPIYPAWDTSVCHDHGVKGYVAFNVLRGIIAKVPDRTIGSSVCSSL